MRIKRSMTWAGVSLCLAGAAVLLGACSSVPKPAEADGSTRVPANDTARVEALQQRVAADRQMMSENALLRAQVEVLQAKLNEMVGLVREALVIPPAQRSQTAPTPALPPPVPSPQSIAVPDLPTHAYAGNSTGVVIRVFHAFARTEFEPSDQLAQALRSSVRGADRIEVRGHTDSNLVNPIDKLIAIERAEKARTWLVNNGADGSKISTKYFTAGHFFVENKSPQGRSMNRRVEIDIQNRQLAGRHLASS